MSRNKVFRSASVNVTSYFLNQLLKASISSTLLNGLVAYYPFGPSLTADVTGDGNTFTNENTVTQGVGPVKYAAEFSGANYFLDSGGGPVLANATYTIAFWANFSSLAGTQLLVAKDASAGRDFDVRYSGGEFTFGQSAGQVGVFVTPTIGQWNLIVAQHDE